MIKRYRKNQLSKVFLVLIALVVLIGGLCLAGKPSGTGGGGTQPRDIASLETLFVTGFQSDRTSDPGYTDGAEGVRSVIAENSGYQFMSAYRPYTPPRTVFVDLTQLAGDNGNSPFTYKGYVPLHLAIMWDIWRIPVSTDEFDYSKTGGMGGWINLNGKMYYFRFNNSEPYYASPVKVTRTGQDSWTVESTPPHLVRLLGTGKKGVELDLGLYTLPLKLTLTVTKAYVPYTYAQKSNALEDIFTWSPRGDRIGLAASDPDGDHTIQVIDLQTGSVLGEYGRGVFASAPRGLAWANRGEMLAFSANGHYGQETVFVLNLRTGSLVEIGLGFTPRWAPDDSRLIFISEDGISIFDLARGAVVTVPRNSPDLIR